jgi:hypothetical protein
MSLFRRPVEPCDMRQWKHKDLLEDEKDVLERLRARPYSRKACWPVRSARGAN